MRHSIRPINCFGFGRILTSAILVLSFAASASAQDPVADLGQVELIQEGFQFTEGPAWNRQHGFLLFTDIPAAKIYRWREGGKAEVWRESSGEANGLLFDAAGRLWACEHKNRRVSRTVLAADGTDSPSQSVVETLENVRLNSPNDLCLTAKGGLFFTDPPYGLKGKPSDLKANHVFFRTPEGEMNIVWKGGEDSRPNGIGLAPDGQQLYVAFTKTGKILRFSVGAHGATGPATDFAQTVGGADGMAIDRKGHLYVTSRAGIEVFDAQGKRLGQISVPRKPANCAFGGPDGRTLFITAGAGLYRLRTAVPGIGWDEN